MASTDDHVRSRRRGGADAPVVRPMRDDDIDGVLEVAGAAFTDLDERMGNPPSPPRDRTAALVRFRHPLETDPGGAWVAEHDGRVVGAAEAIDREGVWGLSLLVVHPDVQSAGVGRALLHQALAYASGGTRGGIILSSEDPRAMRAYARAGFDLDPALTATGRVRVPPAMPETVRPGGPGDVAEADAIGRDVRGAGHGPDFQVWLDAGYPFHVVPGRGFAVSRDGDIVTLAARDEEAARNLLRAILAQTGELDVGWLTSAQRWALPIVLEAGLELRFGGAVFTRGDVGPFEPYIPSGAYL